MKFNLNPTPIKVQGVEVYHLEEVKQIAAQNGFMMEFDAWQTKKDIILAKIPGTLHKQEFIKVSTWKRFLDQRSKHGTEN